jgi:hypothetical protein
VVQLKIITIKQPWATLISQGYKKYEFRSWKTNYRGPLLIHAGKGVDSKAMKRFGYLNFSYPKSKIIAKVELEDCILICDSFNNQLLSENEKVYGSDNKVGLYAWKLSNIEKISIDEDIKGKLGLWNIEI